LLLARYRLEYPRDSRILAVSHYLINYPFADQLFPNSLKAVAHSRRSGESVIVSDGDVVFQPLKIQRSGLMDAFDSRVLIYIHKEHELDDIAGLLRDNKNRDGWEKYQSLRSSLMQDRAALRTEFARMDEAENHIRRLLT